jgi:hypothetical protein
VDVSLTRKHGKYYGKRAQSRSGREFWMKFNTGSKSTIVGNQITAIIGHQYRFQLPI